jgi:hypothetical protein
MPRKPSLLHSGTLIHLMISRDKVKFMGAGKIIYVHDRMGIIFTEVPADQMGSLESWLDELKVRQNCPLLRSI